MRRAIVLALSLIAVPGAARAQVPPPVDLNIQNLPQETPVWCWAAVAQQIIYRLRGPQATPAQCSLVGMANGATPAFCCQSPQACMTTGSLGQIQSLILAFGGRYSYLSPPADPMSVYRTLASGRAIIMAVQSSPYAGHVVVIRGMSWVPTGFGLQPVLHINDPLAYFTQPVPYANVLGYWRAAIVVS